MAKKNETKFTFNWNPNKIDTDTHSNANDSPVLLVWCALSNRSKSLWNDIGCAWVMHCGVHRHRSMHRAVYCSRIWCRPIRIDRIAYSNNYTAVFVWTISDPMWFARMSFHRAGNYVREMYEHLLTGRMETKWNGKRIFYFWRCKRTRVIFS